MSPFPRNPPSRERRRIVWLGLGLLFAYLVGGLTLADDYGISWDEQINREFGHRTLDAALARLGLAAREPDPAAAVSVVEYGPAFELALAGLERLVGPGDDRDAFLLRHRATFVVWWGGVLCFYFFLRRLLDDAWLALLGACALALSPRLFADAFYNSKDATLAALFSVSSLTLLRVLERPSQARLLLHALASAACIGVRLVGLLLPALTFALLGLQAFTRRATPGATRAAAGALFAYTAALVAFVFLLWPQLWDDPAARFREALASLGEARQLDNAFALYFGRFVSVKELPWHYLPTWMALTTPPYLLVLLLLGLALAIHRLRRDGALAPTSLPVLLVLALFTLPLLAVLLLQPVLYDGWRHFYFVQPALVAIAFLGVREAGRSPALRRLGLGFVALGLAATAFAIMRLHPHQQVYFNVFAPAEVERHFEVDYWGLSYREGLEEILRREPSGTVNVAVADLPGFLNAMILPKADRDRIRFTPIRDATYFVSNHRQPRQHQRFLASEGPYAHEIFAVRVGGAHLLGVYRLRE